MSARFGEFRELFTFARFSGVNTLGPNPASRPGCLGRLFAGAIFPGQEAIGQRKKRQEGHSLPLAFGQHSMFRVRGETDCIRSARSQIRAPVAAAFSASRSWSTEKLEQPISRTLPSRTRSFSAPRVSAMGVPDPACAVGRDRCVLIPAAADCLPRRRTWAGFAPSPMPSIFMPNLVATNGAVALGFQGAAKKFFAAALIVDIRGVEKVNAGVQRGGNDARACCGIRFAIQNCCNPVPTSETSSEPMRRVSIMMISCALFFRTLPLGFEA